MMNHRLLKSIDWVLLGLVVAISCLSLFVLSSAGYDPKTQNSLALKKQAIYVAMGVGVFLVCTFIKMSVWKYWAYFIYTVGCLMLLGVIFYGDVGGGAQRWLDLKIVRLQPSEVMKIGLIVALSRFLARDTAPKAGYGLVDLILPGIIVGIPAALIFAQPDLGTALTLIMISGSMLWFVGIKRKVLLLMVFTAVVVAVPAWNWGLKDYQRDRVLTFMNPELDPLGKGYHAIQSKIAVGSGGTFGKGYKKGTQTQLRFLPEQNTDFIFSVLAEENGFIGSFVLLSLYFFLILRVFFIASKADKFSTLLSFGIAAYMFWQLFVNIGMVIGILPVVGITLPLVSYGGTSVISFYVSLGLVSSVAARRQSFK